MTATQPQLPDFVREHDIDAIKSAIIENTPSNTRYEMNRVETTAVSPVTREQSDQFSLIADRHGRMVIGQFGSAINAILEHSPSTAGDLRDGDVIALNDPYYEGMRMPPLELNEGGTLNEELLAFFCHNTRLPKMVEADIAAIAAGTAARAARAQELCKRFSEETYPEACDVILDRSRRGLIDLIRTHRPDGERFEFSDLADDDGLGNGPIKLQLARRRDGDHLHLDWTGTGDQVPGSVNFLLSIEMFKIFAGVFLIMAFAPALVFNDGY